MIARVVGQKLASELKQPLWWTTAPVPRARSARRPWHVPPRTAIR
jgi:hypothetical protein